MGLRASESPRGYLQASRILQETHLRLPGDPAAAPCRPSASMELVVTAGPDSLSVPTFTGCPVWLGEWPQQRSQTRSLVALTAVPKTKVSKSSPLAVCGFVSPDLRGRDRRGVGGRGASVAKPCRRRLATFTPSGSHVPRGESPTGGRCFPLV